MPQIRIFAIDYSQKIEVTIVAPNHGGEPPRVHLGANGFPLGPKIG